MKLWQMTKSFCIHKEHQIFSDDHDVIHFLTTSLHPPGQEPPPSQKVSVEEQQRLNQEYQEYQKKLEQQRDE